MRDARRSNAPADSALEEPPRAGWPAWAISLVVHASLLTLLMLWVGRQPEGAATEPSRQGGIVLRPAEPSNDEYLDEEAMQGQQAEQAMEALTSDAANPAEQAQPIDPADVLPKTSNLIGAGTPAGGERLTAQGMEGGPTQLGAMGRGRARTRVFGLVGEGSKFVYVFDRSGSTGGDGRSALAASKAELLASLDYLGNTNQFQIVFYNDTPLVFELASQPGRLVLANEGNKAKARRFVESVTAEGGTYHLDAILTALKMAPDVVFFLTDGDQPQLSDAQLRTIRQTNDGRASINVIEFGTGPGGQRENFLKKLARENGGHYGYVNIGVLGGAP